MQLSTSEQDYHTYHMGLLKSFIEQITPQLPFTSTMCSEEDHEFLRDITALYSNPNGTNFLSKGQELLCKVVSTYPHLMPLLYRDLLWFFGGDCLHYMPDEEIALFQRLDEMRHDATAMSESFSYAEARAQVFGLH